ncbi:MAG: tetratricopeptide repeat protein [Treponema sp.]|nr:tetratricopeptide repeat protein [Treponema sp.]
MLSNKTWSNYGRHIYHLKKIRSIGLAVLIVIIAGVSILIVSQFRNSLKNERRDILQVWNEGNYELVYEMSKNALLENPLDYFLLTIHGFSTYQVGISQINNQNMLKFINECIFSLRKALLHKESARDGRVYYVLGKAYGNKGNEYADLAVKYLEIANNLSYNAADISEYLGLAYAAYGDFRKSVEALSNSFVPGVPPSDTLLLSIARSYMAMEEYNMAFTYLQHCVDISPDTKSVDISRLMLAEIYMINGDFDNAEEQFLSIINNSGENAEVRFQLGELYNLKGETTRARSEWRTAYRLDPSHARARARLNI